MRIATGDGDYGSCPTADASRDGDVTVDELIGVVQRSLVGCGATGGAAHRRDCAGGVRFCNVASEAGADILSYGKGAAFVDVDGDGLDDIWASDSDQRTESSFGVSKLYLNQGDGTFVATDAGFRSEDLVSNWTASFADADNDGDPDALVVNGAFAGNGRLAFYRNDWATRGRFVEITEQTGITTAEAPWWGASWADFDSDGDLDLFVTSVTGRPWLFRNLGGLRFEDATAEVGIPVDAVETPQGNPVWFDYDRDGDPDLYRAGMARDWLYRNDGVDGFFDVSPLVDFDDGRFDFVFAAAAADFDQDGWDDLYFGRWTQQDFVMRNRADGSFVPLGRSIGLDMVIGDLSIQGPNDPLGFENTMGLGVGDIDDDGDVDVLIGTGNPSFRYLDLAFCNLHSDSGSLSFGRCGEFLEVGHGPSQTHGIAVGDADADGDSDVFFSIGGMASPNGLPPAVGSRSPDALYRQARPAGHTTSVLLEGTESNRDAVGARVRVERQPHDRHYVVRSMQGFQSQNSRWQTIALGQAGFGRVTVEWPAGGSCETILFAGERTQIVEATVSGLRNRPAAP